MGKNTGFDIDSKKTVVCVVQKGEKDRYTTFTTDKRNRLFFDQMQAKKPDFFLGRVLFAFV